MDIGDIRDRQSSIDQHPQVDNEQHENSTENQSAPATSDDVTEEREKTPMNPTPLYIIFISQSS